MWSVGAVALAEADLAEDGFGHLVDVFICHVPQIGEQRGTWKEASASGESPESQMSN